MRDHEVVHADVLTGLRSLPDQSVQCVVTSPPYWGLRDYGVDGQIGLEPTPGEYVRRLVEVFQEVWRVLRDDGVCWLNLGDSYAGSWGNAGRRPELDGVESYQREKTQDYFRRGAWDDRREVPPNQNVSGVRNKNLVGIPWRTAFALQDAGWKLSEDYCTIARRRVRDVASQRTLGAYLGLVDENPQRSFLLER